MNKIKLKNKKIYLILLITATIVFLLFNGAACTGKGSATQKTGMQGSNTSITKSDKESETTVESDANSEETITIWDSCEPKERIFLMESINNFIKLNPKTNINIRHFRNEEELTDVFSAASFAGAGPEAILVSFDSMQKLAKENIVKDLGKEIDYSIFLPGLVELSSFDGKKYIIPFASSNFLIFYYNRDIIREIPATFDEITAYSKESLSGKDQKYGILFNAHEPEWVIPFIGGYLDWFYDYNSGEIRLNTNAMESTLNFINNLYNTEKIMPKDLGYEDMNNLFKNKEAAMIINNVSAVAEYREAGLNFGVVKIPRSTGAAASPTPMISGLGFMINNNCSSKSFEKVKNFINYMISPDIQTSWTLNTTSYPSISNLEKDKLSSDDIIYNILLQAKVCRGKPQEEDMRLIRDVLKINIENVIAGNITPGEAKDKMQEDIIKLKSGEIKIKDFSSTSTSGKS